MYRRFQSPLIILELMNEVCLQIWCVSKTKTRDFPCLKNQNDYIYNVSFLTF